MATYQSIQTGSGDDLSVTITKPTSLAVGDLMLAGILYEAGNANTISANTPSGWTLINSSNLNTYRELATFYKVADSGDVAASNFTFTASGSTTVGQTIGAILRITNYGIFAGNDIESVGSSTSTTFTVNGGFTPSRANTLFVCFAGATSTVSTNSFSSVALATDNPTWTEQVEFNYATTGGSYDSRMAVYTATRSQSTATGNITVTSSSGDTKNYFASVISIAPIVNGSENAAEVVNYAVGHPPAIPQDIVVEATDPSITEGQPTVWTTTTKS